MVKSINFDEDKVSIIDDACVLCGRCINVCPQAARLVYNNTEDIKNMVKDTNTKTVVSFAPSYISVFGDNYKKVITAMKKLGFDAIEETAVGASQASAEYTKLIEEEKMENIITTSCSSINMLITKYFPKLTEYLAPILSPMLIHGKLIKQKYGEDTKVIFIGPCLSKIKEAEDYPEYIDGAMTFLQLIKWLESENININEMLETEFNSEPTYSSVYPIRDGILLDISRNLNENTLKGKAVKYNTLSVSGLNEVKALLEEIEEGEINNVFVEVNACRGGCVNGPMIPEGKGGWYKNRIVIKEFANYQTYDEIKSIEGDFSREFAPEKIAKPDPTEEQIREILHHIGKYNKADELNCGSCGYSTCREKAIAVFQKRADLYMCLSYLSDINQTLSNAILEVSPNYIVAVDKNMNIKEFNTAMQKLFKISKKDALNRPLSEFINTENIEKVFKEKRDLVDIKVRYENLDIITSQTIVYSENENVAVAIIKDITDEERYNEMLYKTKVESVEMAQKVIDKQMTVAQQIASLLGETTAETKVTLNKLKNLIDYEGRDSNG